MLDSVLRKKWLLPALATLLLLALLALCALILNPRLTKYVESAAFRAEMEKETAKGLHFPQGHFAPIRRTGFLTAATESFRARNGRKAMTSLEAHEVTARFNPLGILLRRWQLDELHIQTGEVGIQTYEPKPEPSPAKPWYHVFLPDHVYLARVWSDPADITWRLREKKGGFFATHLLITPHGRDFEYDATGGTLRSPPLPDLALRHAHLIVTKTLLTLATLDLAAGPKDDGTIHGEGTAGMREDKSVDFKLKFGQLPIREWLPPSWRDYVAGAATGEVHWQGKNRKPESASVEGSFRVADGRAEGIPFLEKLASITQKKSLKQFKLNECSAEISWEKLKGEIRNIAIEDEGKFRIEGAVSLHEQSLGGVLQLGIAMEYLEWLPHAEEVFTRTQGGYRWTTVHLSGTIDQPQQDLSPRVLEALKESPGAFLEVVLRQLGEWLQETFGGQ